MSSMKCTLREWQQLNKDSSTIIVQASPVDGSDSWQPFPIGFSYQFMTYRDEFIKSSTGNHENTVLCCFIAQTDQHRRKRPAFNRQKVEYNLHKRGIYNYPFVRGAAYWSALKNSKFVISPEGNGIDCHRHYEALMAGAIPVVEDNPLIKEKYSGCPILYTKDYSEISPKFLEKKYNEMIDQTYDFSRLFLAFYTEEQQTQISECRDFWLKKLCNK